MTKSGLLSIPLVPSFRGKDLVMPFAPFNNENNEFEFEKGLCRSCVSK
jgi:hypothetical protein